MYKIINMLNTLASTCPPCPTIALYPFTTNSRKSQSVELLFPEDPVHHIQSRFIIAEYLFFPGHLCFWFSEITVSCKFQKILPATVFKHLHIFHLVFPCLPDYNPTDRSLFRLAFFKCIDSRHCYSFEFPTFLMHSAQITGFFFIIHN